MKRGSFFFFLVSFLDRDWLIDLCRDLRLREFAFCIIQVLVLYSSMMLEYSYLYGVEGGRG